jgi:hypothetical protein
MSYNNIIIVLSIMLFAACEKKQIDIPDSSEITLSTEKLQADGLYYVNAYSFDKGKFVKMFTINADVDIVPLTPAEGPGMQFESSTSNTSGFYLNATFDNLNQAEAFFNSYNVAVLPSFMPLTAIVQPYQVYTLKTGRNNFVKILIKNIVNVDESPPFTKADIRYVIQRNGTEEFPN